MTRQTKQHFLLFSLLVLLQHMCMAIEIHYDASLAPDDPYWADTFSTKKFSGTSWNAVNGELTITTKVGDYGIWFGNQTNYDPPNWSMASNCEGNFTSARVRLGSGSGEWTIYTYDGTHFALILLYGDRAEFITSEWDGITFQGDLMYPLDVTQYHTYSIFLKDRMVRYEVDGNPVYSNAAYEAVTSIKNIVIGDASGISRYGYGSMTVDEVTIITEPNIPLINQGDIIPDCIVGIQDLTAFASQWLNTTNNPLYDMSPACGDNTVNLDDFIILTNHWGEFTDSCVSRNLWNVKWFHCDRGHDNDFQLERDGTPVCGSENCGGLPDSCWGPVIAQAQYYEPGSIQWLTSSQGALTLTYPQDYQVYGDTYLYVSEAKTLQVEMSGGGGGAKVWLNNAAISTLETSIVTLNLVDGWNHLEWTAYHQHASATFTINYPFSDNVEIMLPFTPN